MLALVNLLPPLCVALQSLVLAPEPRVRARPRTWDGHSAFEHAEALALQCATARGSASTVALKELSYSLEQTFAWDAAQLRDRCERRLLRQLDCLRPAEGHAGDGLFNEDLRALPLQHGRVCEGGGCSGCCSRVLLDPMVAEDECSTLLDLVKQHAMLPPADGHSFSLYLKLAAASGVLPVHMRMLRLIERARRAVAAEYAVPLVSLSPRQAFLSRVTPETEPQSLHADESSVAAFHYSAVLYLSQEGDDFEGGSISFGDGQAIAPRRGQGLIFSSGWENQHQVGKVRSGERYSMPVFFTTQPARSPLPFAQDDARGRAEALWRHGLMPESLEDFLVFMEHWPRFFDTSSLSASELPAKTRETSTKDM